MDIEKIEKMIKEFSSNRDWDKFHNPKNLAMALSVEASELVEIFQWLDFEQAANLSGAKKEHTRQELADIAIYLLRICIYYNIDLETAIIDKMELNKKKYPLYDKDGNKIDYSKKD